LIGTMACVLTACSADPEVVRPAKVMDNPCTLLSDSVVADLHLVPAEGVNQSPGFCAMSGTVEGQRIDVSVDLASFPVRPKPKDDLEKKPYQLAEDWVASECSEMERWDAQFEETGTGCFSSLAACDDDNTGEADLYTRAVDVLPRDVGGRVKVTVTYKGPQQQAPCDAAQRHVAEIASTYAAAPAAALIAD
jgi:hypothetical protein